MRDVPAIRIDIEYAMKTTIEIVPVAKFGQSDLPHARHYSHAQYHIDRVGKLNPDFGERRCRRPHQIRNYIHGSSLQGSPDQSVQFLVHLRGWRPVISRAGFFLFWRADEGVLLHPSNIVGVRTMIVTTRPFLLVEFDEHPFVDRFLGQKRPRLWQTATPENGFRLTKLGHLVDPLTDVEVGGVFNAKHCITHFASCTCSPDMRARNSSRCRPQPTPSDSTARRLVLHSFSDGGTPSGVTSFAFATPARQVLHSKV